MTEEKELKEMLKGLSEEERKELMTELLREVEENPSGEMAKALVEAREEIARAIVGRLEAVNRELKLVEAQQAATANTLDELYDASGGRLDEMQKHLATTIARLDELIGGQLQRLSHRVVALEEALGDRESRPRDVRLLGSEIDRHEKQLRALEERADRDFKTLVATEEQLCAKMNFLYEHVNTKMSGLGLLKPPSPRDFPCSSCGAKAGERCTTKEYEHRDGSQPRIMTGYHPGRGEQPLPPKLKKPKEDGVAVCPSCGEEHGLAEGDTAEGHFCRKCFGPPGQQPIPPPPRAVSAAKTLFNILSDEREYRQKVIGEAVRLLLERKACLGEERLCSPGLIEGTVEVVLFSALEEMDKLAQPKK